MSRRAKIILVFALVALAAIALMIYRDDAGAQDVPVGVPSTCPEPIYQETPGATVPVGTIEPICTPTAIPSISAPTYVPTNTLPSPVVNTPVATNADGTVTELPGTGSGSKSVTPLLAMFLGIALCFVGGATFVRRHSPSR